MLVLSQSIETKEFLVILSQIHIIVNHTNNGGRQLGRQEN